MSGSAAGGRRLIPALALGVACAAHGAPGNEDPLGWLNRAMVAARMATYTGTYAHSNGGRTSAVRISHMNVGKEEQERIQPLDGPAYDIVRRNDDMFCYFPDSKTVRVDRRITAHFFPAILAGSPTTIAASYEVKLGRTENVLEYNCQWIHLRPHDALRYEQALCSEVNSGLVVRAKTFNAQHHVIEQYTFTDLKIGSQAALHPDVKSIFEARVKRWVTDAQPRDEAKAVDTGWMVTDPPPGFSRLTELHRTLPGRPAPVSQLVYSDGVATLSVFVESNTTPPRTADASNEDGTTSFYVRPAGDTLVTVLGEVPLGTAQRFARSVTRRP